MREIVNFKYPFLFNEIIFLSNENFELLVKKEKPGSFYTGFITKIP